MDESPEELFERAMKLFKRGEMLKALPFFEKASALEPSNSICLSYLALLTGIERGLVQEAIGMAKQAIAQSPEIPELYVNLGMLYIKSGENDNALEAVRKGIKNGITPEAEMLLNEVSPRMRPFFPFLRRGNFLNRFAGKFLKKTGLRRFRVPVRKKKNFKIQLIAKKGW